MQLDCADVVACVHRVSVVKGPSRLHRLYRSCTVSLRSSSAQEMVNTEIHF